MVIGCRVCFNSSVGILSVGTFIVAIIRYMQTVVSIPQSEFCPLGHSTRNRRRRSFDSFNSSVGILSVGTWLRPSPYSRSIHRFNSSVGILSVGTHWDLSLRDYCDRFNSSVGILSVGTGARVELVAGYVSVSIPQSEFCPLGLRSEAANTDSTTKFQFLSRNSVRWDKGSR